MALTKKEIEASKSPQGRKLMSGLLQELHRRGIKPVKGEIRNLMRHVVAEKLEAERCERCGALTEPSGIRSWARRAADSIL